MKIEVRYFTKSGNTKLVADAIATEFGKTAIDLDAGKNLLGAFCQPQLVLCDTELLTSLDKKVLEDGFGEGAKYALLDKKVFDLIKNKDFLMEDFVYLCIDFCIVNSVFVQLCTDNFLCLV